MKELQDRVSAWHLGHFDCFPEACLRKAAAELGELMEAEFSIEADERHGTIEADHKRAAADEAADVVICLFAYASRRNFDLLEAIADKLAVIEGRTPERVHRHGATS